MSTETTGEIRLCLAMIVKNESRIIDRCLDSVLPLVQGFVITDTGSTDDTRAKIIAAGERHQVPGTVIDDPWKNFGESRTRNADRARRWVAERWPLGLTYLLTVDADMVLRRLPSFDRQSLTAIYYQIEQRAPDLRWFNTRLLRLSHEWRSVGVTHEFWAPTPNAMPDNLLSLYIDDLGDGGAKSDKSARDIRLLTEGLEKEPDNVRYLFYLAQSYFDIGKYAEAIPLYKRRRDLGGWDEECWFSGYKIGRAELARGNESLGLTWLLSSYQERPGRAEPIAHLARYYREKGKSALAMLFARHARQIPLSADSLFVEPQAHHAMPLEDIAISAYYVGARDEGMRACEELLSEPGTPYFHDHIARCASFYVQPLGPHALRKGEFTVDEEIRRAPGKFFGLEAPNTTAYLCSNPTIVEHQGHVFVNVRLVNYYHERGRVFAPKDPDGVVRTRNVIQDFFPDSGAMRAEWESEIAWPEGWDYTTRVRGLEDQRWHSHGGRIWLTGTCFNIPGAGGMPRVVLGLVDPEIDGIERLVELKFSGSKHYEKNWLPWSRDGELVIIYGYSPFVILDVGTGTGTCEVRSAHPPPFPTHRWRGSAGPVPLGDDRWLLIIHETAWFEGAAAQDQRTVYMHRFVEVVGDKITRKSPLFTFDHSGVEYAAGLLVTRNGVIVTHSIEESSAHWKEFSFDTIEALLSGATHERKES